MRIHSGVEKGKFQNKRLVIGYLDAHYTLFLTTFMTMELDPAVEAQLQLPRFKVGLVLG